MTIQFSRVILPVGLLAASLATAAAASAETETIPVMGAATSTALTGTVTVVNQEKRMLTIKTPEGRFVVLHVPEAVSRLDEVKIGNLLTIAQTDAVLLDVKKGEGTAPIGESQTSTMERDPGTKPSGSIVDTTTLSGRVKSVSKAKSTVTIQGPNDILTLRVEDPELLESLAPGDGVEATYMRVISGEVKFQ